jgi:hypothetical protein
MKNFATRFEGWISRNSKPAIRKGLPSTLAGSTWKAKADHFTNLQINPGSFAEILQQSNLLSPLKSLYVIMAEWFDIDSSGGLRISKYDKLFLSPGAASIVPQIKIQVANTIDRVYQQTVRSNQFTTLMATP